MKLDKWLLERVFEPAAREVESWTGLTHTWLVRFCALVGVMADATRALRERTPGSYALLGICLLVAACLVMLSFVAEHERRRRLANEYKHTRVYAYVRIIQLVLAALSLAISLLLLELSMSTITSASQFAAWYFLSCDRLPPKERRVWLPALFQAR